MIFDPFDEKHQNKNKRKRKRRKIELLEAKFEKQSKIDNAFRKALEEWGYPSYVESHLLLVDTYNHYTFYHELRKNMNKSMMRLGYEKMMNQNSKDGRWRFYRQNTYIYKKKGIDDVNYLFLKNYF